MFFLNVISWNILFHICYYISPMFKANFAEICIAYTLHTWHTLMLKLRNNSRLDRNIIYTKSRAGNILCTFFEFVTFLWCRAKSNLFFSKCIPDQKDFIFQFIFTTYFALHTNLLFYWIETRSFVIPILLSSFVSFDSWLKYNQKIPLVLVVLFSPSWKRDMLLWKNPFKSFPEFLWKKVFGIFI